MSVCCYAVSIGHSRTTMSNLFPAVVADVDGGGKDSSTDAADSAAGYKGMMEFFRKRYQSAGGTTLNPDDLQAGVVCEASASVDASSSVDADSRSLASERFTTDVHKDYGYYHTVSSSDARVLRAALAKERVPIFRRSESKARRSMAGAGMRLYPTKDRVTEGEMLQTDSQSLSSGRSDSKGFREIFLRQRNRSDRSAMNAEATSEKRKSGSIRRIRNFLVSFRSRPRSVSVSYAPEDMASTGTSAAPASSAAVSVQTVGKKKKFKVTPATLLPVLRRPEPPRIGPEDFVEMYCRSRTTSDPRSDALLKARVAASLHKVSSVWTCFCSFYLLELGPVSRTFRDNWSTFLQARCHSCCTACSVKARELILTRIYHWIFLGLSSYQLTLEGSDATLLHLLSDVCSTSH